MMKDKESEPASLSADERLSLNQSKSINIEINQSVSEIIDAEKEPPNALLKTSEPTPDSHQGFMENNKTDDLKKEENKFIKVVIYPVEAAKQLAVKHKKLLKIVCGILLALGVTAYMIAACVRNFSRALPLLVIWSLVVVYNIYAVVRDRYGGVILQCCQPCGSLISFNMYWIKWFLIALLVVALILWIVLETLTTPNQLISLVGYFVFLFILLISSKYPTQVKWRPILLGFVVQLCFGLLILRTQAGFSAFQWIGKITRDFIDYVLAGVKLVYGDDYAEHYIAFVVLSIVIYFSAFISILYYLGAMQWLILKLAWLMQISLKTSATESMVAAGNVFVGLAESPLLIRPYLDDLTTSELHAVMTAGFGTIAGSVLGAYLGFGIQPVYLVTSCFMAAPCSLAVSKLVYPETKKSKFTSQKGLIIEKSDQQNVIEAAFVGASQAIPLVLNIAANLIAFFSLLAALNGLLSWFGNLMDFPELSFELICSYVFVPVTFLMGIEWTFCFKAAELIGIKIFLNEFIAYQSLSKMLKQRDSGHVPMRDPTTGQLNWVDERTEAIVTYALCGFANFASMGIMLGALGALAPKRRGEMSAIVLRTLFAGIFVSILNACIAGFLYVPHPIKCDQILSTTNWTFAEPSRLFACCSDVLEMETSNATKICDCCGFAWNQTDYILNCTRAFCY